VREERREQGCKYAGDNEQKAHEKMTNDDDCKKRRSSQFSGKK